MIIDNHHHLHHHHHHHHHHHQHHHHHPMVFNCIIIPHSFIKLPTCSFKTRSRFVAFPLSKPSGGCDHGSGTWDYQRLSWLWRREVAVAGGKWKMVEDELVAMYKLCLKGVVGPQPPQICDFFLLAYIRLKLAAWTTGNGLVTFPYMEHIFETSLRSRWWQLKYFLEFSPRILGEWWSNLTSIFFKWAETTT